MELALYFPDKADMLDLIFKHPTMKPKKHPSVEQAMKTAVSVVGKTLTTAIADELLPVFKGILENKEMLEGSFEEVGEALQDDYSSDLDDKVEASLEPYLDYLSADWLGVNTIDTQLHVEGEPEKLATSAGKQIVKMLSHEVKDVGAKVISRAGVVEADLIERLEAQQNQTKEQKEQTLAEEQNDLDAVIARIVERVGKDFDIMEMYDSLELASGDDEVLAAGAAARIGAEGDDVQQLQLVALTEADPAQFLLDKITEVANSAKKPAKKAKAKARTKTDGTPPEGSMDVMILKAIKEHSAIKDTELSEKLGISRTTFNSWLKGSSPFAPDEDQIAVLDELLRGDIDELSRAHAELTASAL